MKCKFKMVFTLKDNADPAKFAEIIDKMLACYNSTCEKTIQGSQVEFYTSVHEYYSGMWGVVIDVLESRMLPYLDALIWTNYETNNEEDVLTEFLEDCEEKKNGDK